MEGSLSELPIRFRENREGAGLATVLWLAVGLMALWLHHSYATHPSSWATVRNHAAIPVVAPLLETIALCWLRWSLTALILSPTFFEIREAGLWFARFGLVPWSCIGRLELKPVVLKSSLVRDTTHLRIEVKDLPERIRALPWLSRIERWLTTSREAGLFVTLGGGRLTRSAADVAELIEAHLPKASSKATP